MDPTLDRIGFWVGHRLRLTETDEHGNRSRDDGIEYMVDLPTGLLDVVEHRVRCDVPKSLDDLRSPFEWSPDL